MEKNSKKERKDERKEIFKKANEYERRKMRWM